MDTKMECLIPTDVSIPTNDYDPLKASHNKRQFVIFDEQLKICLHMKQSKNVTIQLNKFVVWINDAMMLQSQGFESFNQLDGQNIWELKPTVCSDGLFRSTVVMNNGYDNHIRFNLSYSIIDNDDVKDSVSGDSFQVNSKLGDDVDPDSDDDILPSFEPIYYWSNVKESKADDKGNSSVIIREEDETLEEEQANAELPTNEKVISLEFPIYSLLNMRLRNTSLKSKQCIMSSLDFQTSKASIQLTDKYVNNKQALRFHFNEVVYELLDRNSHIRVDPIIPLEVPFEAMIHDSFSVCYKLPLLDTSSLNINPHRVRIKLIYTVAITLNSDDEMKKSTIELPVMTTWETEVTLKKPMNNGLSRVTSASVLSTPKLYGMTRNFTSLNNLGPMSTANNNTGSVYNFSSNNVQQSSMQSLMNNRLNNIKFKFLNNNLRVQKGEKFHMRLQIVNLSNASLDLVVYYNNNKTASSLLNATANNNIASSTNNLTLTKQFQIQKTFSKITEGIILLSNDYKIPIINSNETYFVDLSFISIMSGYYSTLPGLKVLDLQTNELIEIGLAASLLVQ